MLFASLLLASIALPQPHEEREHNSLINYLVVAGVVAPIIETSILLWLVSLLTDLFRHKTVIVLAIASIATFAHLAAGKNLVQIIFIAVAFGAMSLYAIRRIPIASFQVAWWELFAIHSANNSASVLLGSAVS
jgi:hypothetical protein